MPCYSRYSTKQDDPNMEGYSMVFQPLNTKWEFAHILSDKGSYGADTWRYLEAAPNDQSTGSAWSDISGTEIGATAQGTAVGTGQGNTTAIVGQLGCTLGAAKVCKAYSGGGYTDWFLPSKDELNAMYGKKAAIGGFVIDWYWSSTEYRDAGAWKQSFETSEQYNDGAKISSGVYVRV